MEKERKNSTADRMLTKTDINVHSVTYGGTAGGVARGEREGEVMNEWQI